MVYCSTFIACSSTGLDNASVPYYTVDTMKTRKETRVETLHPAMSPEVLEQKKAQWRKSGWRVVEVIPGGMGRGSATLERDVIVDEKKVTNEKAVTESKQDVSVAPDASDKEKKMVLDSEVKKIEKESGLSLTDLRSDNRHKTVVAARKRLCNRLRRRGFKIVEIASCINKHHSSVMYLLGLRKNG